SNVLATDILRVQRGDMHGDVMAELLESVGGRDEVGLAVPFPQPADFPARVDVAADQPFRRFTGGLLGGRGLPLLAKDGDGLFDVSGRFNQSRTAIVEAGVGPVAQFLYESGWNFHGCVWCAHFLFSSTHSDCARPRRRPLENPARFKSASSCAPPYLATL